MPISGSSLAKELRHGHLLALLLALPSQSIQIGFGAQVCLSTLAGSLRALHSGLLAFCWICLRCNFLEGRQRLVPRAWHIDLHMNNEHEGFLLSTRSRQRAYPPEVLVRLPIVYRLEPWPSLLGCQARNESSQGGSMVNLCVDALSNCEMYAQVICLTICFSWS